MVQHFELRPCVGEIDKLLAERMVLLFATAALRFEYCIIRHMYLELNETRIGKRRIREHEGR